MSPDSSGFALMFQGLALTAPLTLLGKLLALAVPLALCLRSGCLPFSAPVRPHVEPYLCDLCNVLAACRPTALHSLAFPASLHQGPLRLVISPQSLDFEGLSFDFRSWRPRRRTASCRPYAFRNAWEIRKCVHHDPPRRQNFLSFPDKRQPSVCGSRGGTERLFSISEKANAARRSDHDPGNSSYDRLREETDREQDAAVTVLVG